MAFAELVNMHPDIDMKALADMADDIEQIDAEKLNHKCDGECEDEPYEPQSKYDGHMYG
jgi:hypothetical protein